MIAKIEFPLPKQSLPSTNVDRQNPVRTAIRPPVQPHSITADDAYQNDLGAALKRSRDIQKQRQKEQDAAIFAMLKQDRIEKILAKEEKDLRMIALAEQGVSHYIFTL